LALAVLHVTSEYPPLQFGGLGTAVEGLVGASAAAGIPVAVLVVHGGETYGYGTGAPYGYGYASGGHGARSQERQGGSALSRHEHVRAPLDGVTVYEAPFQAAFDQGIALAKECRADVVHLHSSWLWPVARTIRDATGTPIVYTAHSLDRAEVAEGEWVSHGPIQDVAIRDADRVVALSRSERERLERFYPGTSSRVRVVGNGITLAANGARASRRRPEPATSIVLYVGRFALRKGITDLFDAIPLVVERVPRASFVVAGGDSPEALPSYCASWLPPRVRRSSARIEFLGWQRRVRCVGELHVQLRRGKPAQLDAAPKAQCR
jgi:glycosyltransferase involved in cell wall biosynthesis